MESKTRVVLAMLVASLPGIARSASAQEYVPGEVLVVFKAGVQRAAVDQVMTANAVRVIEHFEHAGVYHVTVAPGKTVPETVALLEQNANVKGASPNYIRKLFGHLTIPDDDEFSRQWALNNTGRNLEGVPNLDGNEIGVIDADIDAPQAWDHLTDCSGEVVAIMDTGIDFGHRDFAGNEWVNPGEIPTNGIDDDENGFVDDVNGADLISKIRHDEEIGTSGVDTNGVYDPGECIYNDQDSSNSVTEFDTRLTACAGFAAGTVVAMGDGDMLNLLVPFVSGAPLFERHNDADGNGIYSVGDAVYIDRDGSGTVTVADTRCMTVGALPPGPVVAGDADIGTVLIEIHARSGDVTDLQGHGTNVASVVGARGDNGVDVTGVCWRVNLMALRVGHPVQDVFGLSAVSTLANFIGGVNYVIGVKMRPLDPVNVRIINYSYGGFYSSPAELEALRSVGVAGILFVTAAGNEGIDVDAPFDPDGPGGDPPLAPPVSFPCAYTPTPVDSVVCVGATDNRDRLADFSNWGTTSVDLNAPGVDILMCSNGGGTEYASGTSFAAPHVAGIAAHFWSLPGFEAHTIDELKDRLLTGMNGPLGVPHPHGVDPRFGGQFAPGPAGPAVGSVVSGINHDGRARMVMGDDFGDAPDPPYPTKLASNGARHEDIGEEWLGRDPDCPYGEPQPPGFSDVSPEFDAFNDPAWPGDPDEFLGVSIPNLPDHDFYDDGIDLVGPFVFGGAPATVIVYIDTENNLVVDGDGGRYGPGGHAGTCGVHDPLDDKYVWVNGFFDWNNDGDWDDFAEHVFTLEADPSLWPTSGGVYEITFTMPPAPDERYSDQLWARFRVDYGENLGQPLIPPIFPVGPSPGGWVDYWDVPGIPWVPGAYAPNRYESVFVGGPPDLDLTYGVAQFGEVEDYYLESDYFPVSEGTIDIDTPLGSDTVTLIGPTTVLVDIAGLADVDTDGLEEVTTEIVQLELTGTSGLLGPVTVRLRPHTSAPFERSTGLIEELSNDTPGVLDLPPFAPTGSAFSFFDVYFEIEVGGEIYHNNDPKHMETDITCKPPAEGEMYEAPEVIWLFDEDGNPTGVSIGTGSHTPDPFPPPPPVPIVSAESCMVHDDPCGEMCLPIDCSDPDPPYDKVEPRLQLGTPPVLKIHCYDPVAPGTASCSVSCVPNDYAGTATVVSDGSPDAEVHFSDTLPDQSCCTLEFTGSIQDIWTIVMLEADVNRDGMVSTADASSVKARLEMSVQVVGAPYDVNRDCMMSTADRSSVKARLEHVAPVPCLCEAGPMFGACCDPYTGDCLDDIDVMDCLSPLVFEYQEECAQLEPPCGQQIGACCCGPTPEPGVCEAYECIGDMTAAQCVVLGEETFWAGDESCEASPPYNCGAPFIFEFDPGTGPPPETQCGCTMTDFPLDDSSPVYDDVTSIPSPCPAGGDIEFSTPLSHRRIGDGWMTWSHGYTEDVYYTSGSTQVTITLPPAARCGFYTYVEPNPLAEHTFKLIANGLIESEEFTAHGSAGAAYAGVCGAGLETITVVSVDGTTDFAIGEFGICCSCEPGSGDCCYEHCAEGPGCEDPVCEASVCSYDSYCCFYCWESICADEAASDPSCDCGGAARDFLYSYGDAAQLTANMRQCP